MTGVTFPGVDASGVSQAIGRAVAEPAWRIEIDNSDVTLDLNPYVTSARYTDNVHGEIDDVELILANTDGRFSGEWMPEEGTRIRLWLGYVGAPLLPCGSFEVADISVEGPPDVVTITALAAGPKAPLRTRRSVGYDGQTLDSIARTVAARHNLAVVGPIRDVPFKRVTQNEETDLQFLSRLADEHGYVTSVRDDQLVFLDRQELEGAAPTWSLSRDDVARFRLQRRTRAVYRACEVTYHDAAAKKTVTHTVIADGVTTGDVLKVRTRVENLAQAEDRARVELHRRNGKRVEGSIDMEGTTRCMAGTNGTLVGFGTRLDGTYHVVSSAHQLSRRSGYVTTLDLRQVG